MGRKRILGCSGIATGFLTIFKYYTSVKAQSFILSTEITAFSWPWLGLVILCYFQDREQEEDLIFKQ